VPRVWSLTETILEVIDDALAYGCERVDTSQGLGRSGVVVAPSKDDGPVGLLISARPWT
jgi:hypothetical protein